MTPASANAPFQPKPIRVAMGMTCTVMWSQLEMTCQFCHKNQLFSNRWTHLARVGRETIRGLFAHMFVRCKKEQQHSVFVQEDFSKQCTGYNEPKPLESSTWNTSLSQFNETEWQIRTENCSLSQDSKNGNQNKCVVESCVSPSAKKRRRRRTLQYLEHLVHAFAQHGPSGCPSQHAQVLIKDWSSALEISQFVQQNHSSLG